VTSFTKCFELIADELATKIAIVEDLRSERRILEAERDEAMRKLSEIQDDLKKVGMMERKLDHKKDETDVMMNTYLKDVHMPTRGD
jgi:hypothetical protein